jgi:enediyne polyketide synthase
MTTIKNPNINVSLSHDERLVLTTASYSVEGCDIEIVKPRHKEEWYALLGNNRKPLMEQLINGNDSLDVAGTRIWVALEAILKAQDIIKDIKLSIERHEGDSVLFYTDSINPPIRVITFPIKLTRGKTRLVSMVVQTSYPNKNEGVTEDLLAEKISEAKLVQPKVTSNKVYKGLKRWFPTFAILVEQIKNLYQEKQIYKQSLSILLQFGYNPDVYSIAGEQASTGHKIFIHRFPITFKENANLSGSVYFSHYFSWMGKVRELAMYPVNERIARDFTTENWGMVTNFSKTNFLGEVKNNDVIEVRFWMGKISGSTQSTFNLYYDWCRILPNGKIERVALSEMQLTWVKVLDHGVVKAEPFPSYFQKFLQERMPSSDISYHPSVRPEPFKELDLGELLYQSPNNPKEKKLLQEQTFETTLEEANLVGNIYFSNYYIWQGRVRDRFLYKQIPNYFRGRGEQGECLCLYSSVQHLTEAMPFDRIYVTMSLKALYEYGIILLFEYFKISADGNLQKLAFGQQDIAWVQRKADKQNVPQKLPELLKNFLLNSAQL